MFNLKKIAPCMYLLPREGNMRVPGLIVASEEFLNDPSIEKPLQQVRNVASLPGIMGYSIAMPDMHWGYGFPIGGVAAMNLEEGVISPGGVGYDINCGVRLATFPLKYKELDKKHQKALLSEIFHRVPSGVGHGHKAHELTNTDYQELLTQGSKWAVGKGLGEEKDLAHTESWGCISGADPHAVSKMAKERGRKQLGSIGSGNHFIEIGEIKKIFQPVTAQTWQLEEGMTYILIHSGSRGFGHQVCQDTLTDFIKEGYTKGLPDVQLVAAPLKSPAGIKYFSTMAAAANFAFNNRQCILHAVREAFASILKASPSDISLLYDVCHNIAKFEIHEHEKKKQKLCVHRKGATRSYGPHSEELHTLFQKTGQPVLVPGDMGRASYLLSGSGHPLTWGSCCHGAGRAHSRIHSMRQWKGKNLMAYMEGKDVQVKANSLRTIAEEMPDAYKDVTKVVDAVQEAKLAKIVAQLRPHLVIKG